MESQRILATALLLIAGASSSVVAQLNLEPQAGVYYGEGTPFPCIRFRDDGKPVRFMPPPNWRFTADGARCSFNPAGVAQAYGSFTAKPLVKDATGDPAERLKQLLMEKVPSGAVAVEFTLTELPSVKLERWPAQHVQASYEHFGQKFRIALLIVPLEREELHVRFGSRAADFDRLFSPLLESLGTFTWNPTDEDPPKTEKPTAARN